MVMKISREYIRVFEYIRVYIYMSYMPWHRHFTKVAVNAFPWIAVCLFDKFEFQKLKVVGEKKRDIERAQKQVITKHLRFSTC
jgi:hypothetical protein